MHSYLRAIGFSNIDDKGLENWLSKIIKAGNPVASVMSDSGELCVEYRQIVFNDLGLIVIGKYMSDDVVKVIDYFPALMDDSITCYAEFEAERLKDRPSYLGIFDDDRLGVSIIFHTQNPVEMFSFGEDEKRDKANIALTGLSVEGKILLPLKEEGESSSQEELPFIHRVSRNKAAMIKESTDSNVENLTMEEMDAYATLARRLEKEDVLTIVDTNMMPYGVESDLYQIIGNILDYELLINQVSKEKVYIITIETNEMEFRIAINQNDLLGQPRIGRRFKGIVWLQGKILV